MSGIPTAILLTIFYYLILISQLPDYFQHTAVQTHQQLTPASGGHMQPSPAAKICSNTLCWFTKHLLTQATQHSQ